jgi:hypothetical protein
MVSRLFIKPEFYETQPHQRRLCLACPGSNTHGQLGLASRSGFTLQAGEAIMREVRNQRSEDACLWSLPDCAQKAGAQR